MVRGESPKMLLEVFNDHNKKCRDLLGKDFVLGTVLRYERTVRYLSKYMKQAYRMTDIPLKDLSALSFSGFQIKYLSLLLRKRGVII